MSDWPDPDRFDELAARLAWLAEQIDLHLGRCDLGELTSEGITRHDVQRGERT